MQKLRIAAVYKVIDGVGFSCSEETNQLLWQADKGVLCPFCRVKIERYTTRLVALEARDDPQSYIIPAEYQQFEIVVGPGGYGGLRRHAPYGRCGVASIGGLNEYNAPPQVTGSEGSGLKKNSRIEDVKEGYIVPPLKPSDDLLVMALDRMVQS